MNENAPCLNCPEKYPGCHDHCDKYKEWKERYQAQQKHLADNKYRMCIPRSHARDSIQDHYIKHPVKGHKGGSQ
jgi:hypothetical protein